MSGIDRLTCFEMAVRPGPGIIRLHRFRSGAGARSPKAFPMERLLFRLVVVNLNELIIT